MSNNNMTLDPRFFELDDVRSIQSRSWIPLRQDDAKQPLIEIPGVGSLRTYSGIATLAVAAGDRDVADKLSWNDLDLTTHTPDQSDGIYRPVDLHYNWTSERRLAGVRLVLAQHSDAFRQIWHLHPDLVFALELEREEDIWYRPSEGWAEVARLKHDAEKRPILLEIRAEMLSDYLAARSMALYASSYHERSAVFEQDPGYSWPDQPVEFTVGRDSFERYVGAAHMPLDPRFRFRASGALWRTEWFQPSSLSTRVRGDVEPGEVTFAVGTHGERKSAAECIGAMTYLAFQPALVPALLQYRGGSIGWYSRDTGSLGAARKGVHFGVNALGLITIFAKDVASLDPWEQRVWAAHSTPLDGGASTELFDTQMNCRPASTKAPETELAGVMDELDLVFRDKFGAPLLRENRDVGILTKRVHRFRAVEHDGLLVLAKDLNRLSIERMDVDLLRSAAGATKENIGSLKALERLVAQVVGAETARALMAPLFGLYDLRIADAHIGSSKVESGLERAKVHRDSPLVEQGRQLIDTFVTTIRELVVVLASLGEPDVTLDVQNQCGD